MQSKKASCHKAFIAIMCGLVLVSCAWGDPGPSKTTTRVMAPTFSTMALDGKGVDVSDLIAKNKAVVINFWGLRCQSCLLEIPHLNAMYRKNKTSGLAIIGVNVDGINGDIIKSQMRNMEHPPEYVVVPDPNLEIADLYELSAAPLTIVIDRSGWVAYTHEGYAPGDEEELQAQVERLLW